MHRCRSQNWQRVVDARVGEPPRVLCGPVGKRYVCGAVQLRGSVKGTG
jgi:hypothetical protein